MSDGHYQKKEDCTMPMVAVSQPYCCAMGRIAMLMFTLSILQSMNAMKHNAMMVHRRFHLLGVPTACNNIRLLDDHRLSLMFGRLPDNVYYHMRLFGVHLYDSCQCVLRYKTCQT
jgi:ABC-type uncharacterized transport system ATPase subunit